MNEQSMKPELPAEIFGTMTKKTADRLRKTPRRLYFRRQACYDDKDRAASDSAPADWRGRGENPMLTREELRKSPLFDGISYESYQAMCSCFHAYSREYHSDDVICDFSGSCDAVGILERGEAVVRRVDENGAETVMETLTMGSVFGRTLDFAGNRRDTLEVVCRSECAVLFIDYDHILKRCEKACTHHSMLVQNMLRLMSEKAQALSERIDVLSRRTIRDKLLCYFSQQRDKAGSDTFELPFSLSMLADYIASDRSAMMRELKKMRNEAVVRTNGRRITLFT